MLQNHNERTIFIQTLRSKISLGYIQEDGPSQGHAVPMNINQTWFEMFGRSKFVTHLDVRETLVQFWIQWRQLVYGAVCGALLVPKHMTEEEWSERNVHNNALKQ